MTKTVSPEQNLNTRQFQIATTYTVFILKVALALVTLYYSYMLIQITTHPYLPAESDGIVYYLASLKFAAMGSLAPSFILNGALNPYVNFGYHGPAYDLVNGVFAKLYTSPYTMIITNFLVITCVSILVYCQNWSLRSRLLACLSLLLYISVPAYAITYMVETIQLLFACILTLLLIKIHTEQQQKYASSIVWVGLYLGCCICFGVFRPTYLLWSIGILPLSRTRKQFLCYLSSTAIICLFTPLLIKLLYAPYPFTYIGHMVDQFKKNIPLLHIFLATFHHSMHNLEAYLFKPDTVFSANTFQSIAIYLVLPIFLVTLTKKYYQTKDKALLGVLLIGIVNLMMLIVFNSWKNALRLLTPVYILFVLYSGWRRFYVIMATQLFLLIMLLPLTYHAVNKLLTQRQITGKYFALHPPKATGLYRTLYQLKNNNKAIYILTTRNMASQYAQTMLSLPLWNVQHQPIYYVMNLNKDQLIGFGKLPYKYILVLKNNALRQDPKLKKRKKIVSNSEYGLWGY